MEIRHLEEFIVLAEYLNFGEAALYLNMSQSTLSKHIHVLETELGAELFKRSTRRMTLSPFGGFYLPYAREMSALYKASGLKTREYLAGSTSALTLASVRNMQFLHVERYIIGFREVYPECRVNVIECEEHALLSMFRQRQINLFTACVFENETPEYGFLPLTENHLVALLPEEHRLSDCYALSLGQLKNENLMLPGRNSKMHRALTAAFVEAGITPHIVYEGDSAGCLELVQAGMGIALQPKEFDAWKPDKSVSCVDIKPLVSYRCGLGYRNDESLTVSEKKLLAYLRQFANARRVDGTEA